MKHFDKELVSGSVVRSVWKLAWPTVLLNLGNGLHGFVDHVLVGRYLGTDANAGLGVAWQLFIIMIVFSASLFHGMGVLIARYAGEKNREAMSEVAFQTFLACIFLILFIIAPIGLVGAPLFLDLVRAGDGVQVHALPYLRIMFAFGAPLFLMFLLNGALQASGNAKTPLMLGILTNLLNIGMSIVLITGMGPFPALGAAGAAIATCIAPLPSIVIVLTIIFRGKTIIKWPEHLSLIPNFKIIKEVARIGIPSGIQGVLLNLGGLLLLRKVGSLPNGGDAQAAYAICYTQLFSIVVWVSFGLRSAAATLMGQNLGARNPERAKKTVVYASYLGGIWAASIGLAYWFAPGFFLGLFSATAEPVFSYATLLLKYLAVSGVIISVTLALTGGLQGAGDTKGPMYIAFITQIVVLLGVCELYDLAGRLTPGAIWSAILISHASRFVLTYALFHSGRWAKIKLTEMERAEAGEGDEETDQPLGQADPEPAGAGDSG